MCQQFDPASKHFKMKKKIIKHEKSLWGFIFTLTFLSNIFLSNNKLNLASSIFTLLLLTVTYAYKNKIYKNQQVIIFTIISFILLYFSGFGLTGVYFLLCFILFFLLYLIKKMKYLMYISILSYLGFLTSFLFFKLYMLYDIESILTILQLQYHETLNVDPKSLTINFKILLQNSDIPVNKNELVFLLDLKNENTGFNLLLRFLLGIRGTVGTYTNFLTIYAYMFSFFFTYIITFIKICIIIS